MVVFTLNNKLSSITTSLSKMSSIPLKCSLNHRDTFAIDIAVVVIIKNTRIQSLPILDLFQIEKQVIIFILVISKHIS